MLQADLSDLPFRSASFGKVLCLNVLHQVEHADALISRLNGLVTPDGQLYLTSLIANSRFVGDHYLNVLYAAGELVRPRGNLELREIVEESLGRAVNYRVKANMAFVTSRAAVPPSIVRS